jgi:hypothetical protein
MTICFEIVGYCETSLAGDSHAVPISVSQILLSVLYASCPQCAKLSGFLVEACAVKLMTQNVLLAWTNVIGMNTQ